MDSRVRRDPSGNGPFVARPYDRLSGTGGERDNAAVFRTRESHALRSRALSFSTAEQCTCDFVRDPVPVSFQGLVPACSRANEGRAGPGNRAPRAMAATRMDWKIRL